MGESEIAATKQIAMPYIKAATKEFFYADDKLSLAFRHTDQYDEELYYVRTIKTRLMLTAHASGVSMDELSRITGLPKMTIAQQINAVDLTDVDIADYFVYKENLPTYVAKERELEARIRHAHIRQAILMRVAHTKGMDIKTPLVVKLVDTSDSKSDAHHGCVGSTPTKGTTKQPGNAG